MTRNQPKSNLFAGISDTLKREPSEGVGNKLPRANRRVLHHSRTGRLKSKNPKANYVRFRILLVSRMVIIRTLFYLSARGSVLLFAYKEPWFIVANFLLSEFWCPPTEIEHNCSKKAEWFRRFICFRIERKSAEYLIVPFAEMKINFQKFYSVAHSFVFNYGRCKVCWLDRTFRIQRIMGYS